MGIRSTLQTLRSIWNHPLNTHRKIAAIKRFFSLQLAMRATRCSLVVPWFEGLKVILSPGECGISQNLYCGLHDAEEMLLLLHTMQEGDLFADIGSNVGSYTLLASGVCRGKSVAFEPVPSTFQRLSTNIMLNDLAALVTAKNIGLSDKPGALRFTSDENAMNRVLKDGETASSSIEVQVSTLDNELGAAGCFAMKIDVEGFERYVLEGGQRSLDNPNLQLVIMEVNNSGVRYGSGNDEVVQILEKYEFNTYGYDPFRRVLSEAHNRKSGNNAIFLRDANKVKDRITKAKHVRVNGIAI